MKEEHKFFINGVWVDPSSTEIIEVENPATEEIIGTIAAGSKAVSYTHLTLPTILRV